MYRQCMGETSMSEALERAWALREEFENRGEFKQSDYRKALRERLKDLPGVDADAIARKVDRECCKGN